jgi:hypothetical protein
MRTTLVLTVVLLASVAGGAWGQISPLPWDVQKELALYGNLDQHDVPEKPDVACAPVSAVNSFVYLEQKYKGVYDRKLIPDTDCDTQYDYAELISVASTLEDATYMNTTDNGTYGDNFIWGKRKYIEEKVPGVTNYKAQYYWAWGDHPSPPPGQKPDWVEDNKSPTWQFFYTELMHCEDVEIGMVWENGTRRGGHAVTLTSFHWTDNNPINSIIDKDEKAWIDFIDPDTGAYNTTSIWQSSLGGAIRTSYFNPSRSWITVAVSESPIPEPATITLAILGGGALLALRRRLRRQT